MQDASGFVDSSSLLYAALSEANERASSFLLKHGANPNGRSRPTGEALGIFQRLGCDLDSPLRSRTNSLQHAAKSPAQPAPTSSTLGRSTAKRVCWESVLEVGPTASFKLYPSPLHVAAAVGKVSLVELLLAAGADLDSRMNGEFTPLAVAVLNRQADVVRMLLHCGADVNAADRRGMRPLHLAVRVRRPDLARLLLEHGADPNVRTHHGVAALHVAVEKKQTDLVELLLDSGADANAKTDAGVTPLHCAVVKGHRRIMETLLNRGADVSVIVKKGEIDVTPLLWVTEAERKKITEILVKYVAKSGPVGFYGKFLKKIWKQFSGK